MLVRTICNDEIRKDVVVEYVALWRTQFQFSRVIILRLAVNAQY